MQLSALTSRQSYDYSVKTRKKSDNNRNELQNNKSIISFRGAQGMRSAILASKLTFKGRNIPVPSKFRILPTEENGGQSGIKNLMALPIGKYSDPDSILDFEVTENDKEKQVKLIDISKELLTVKIDKAVSPDIAVKFTKGKDGEVATIIGRNFKAVAIEGSEIKRNGFEFKFGTTKQISFGASYHPVMAFKPEATTEALAKTLPYLNSLSEKKDKELDSNYTVVQVIGGFGTRLRSLVHEDGNKTAANTPTGIPLLAYSLLPVLQAGITVPQEISEKNTTVEDDTAVGIVGGLLEGIENKKIPTDKNLLIVPGDGIHDIDIKPALKQFLKRPDAGMMIIGNAVSQDKISGLGIIGTNTEGLVVDFIEKPKKLRDAVAGIITDKNGRYDKDNPKYNANIAIYVFKPQVLKALVALGDIVRAAYIEPKYSEENLSEHGSKAKEYDFGHHAVPALQVLCNADILGANGKINEKELRMAIQNKTDHPLKKLADKIGYEEAIKQLNPVVKMLKDKNCERLKMIAYAGEGDWADVGSIPQFIQTARDIAAGNSFKNLSKQIIKGFKKNVDLKNGIVYIPAATAQRSPRAAFRRFLGEDGSAKGNIVVMEP